MMPLHAFSNGNYMIRRYVDRKLIG
uniref:Uncharacterized protein n=1 Tax=Rhizophora mucronata TaxID=61149 RepID=A0A2P2R551_RHIMU